MSTSRRTILAAVILVLLICAFRGPVIGTVSGAENEFIEINGITYIDADLTRDGCRRVFRRRPREIPGRCPERFRDDARVPGEGRRQRRPSLCPLGVGRKILYSK